MKRQWRRNLSFFLKVSSKHTITHVINIKSSIQNKKLEKTLPNFVFVFLKFRPYAGEMLAFQTKCRLVTRSFGLNLAKVVIWKGDFWPDFSQTGGELSWRKINRTLALVSHPQLFNFDGPPVKWQKCVLIELTQTKGNFPHWWTQGVFVLFPSENLQSATKLVDTLSFHSTISAPTNTTLFIAKKIVEKTPLPHSMLLVCSPRS